MNRNPLLELDVTSFPIESVGERFEKMNESFQRGDYGEVVNYARSMTESACKYIYKQLSNKKISQVTPFPKLIRSTLELMNSELRIEKTKDVSEQCALCIDSTVKLFQKIGSIRNSTSISHGSEVRTQPISKTESEVMAHLASSFVIFIESIYWNSLHSDKKNAINSVINSEGLEFFSLAGFYREKKGLLTVEYSCFSNSNVIFQVRLYFPNNFSKQQMDDPEFITNHIKDYLEEDAVMMKPKRLGSQFFEYYSPKKDFKYQVIIHLNTITISSI